MKNIMHNSIVAFSALLPLTLNAQTDESAQTAPNQFNYSALPRMQQAGVAPLIMLAVSNDHQLYFKAYTDYDDLDNDGELSEFETTYTDTEEYGGYFSSNHCYTYEDGLFSIAAVASGANNHYCAGAQWSGNFLNWATMTRVDMLRQVLYGGLIYTPPQATSDTAMSKPDTSNLAILERSYLPNDAHSFAKFYNKDDLNQLTPFNTDQGITLCNTTLHVGDNQKKSKENTSPPLMRAIEGNYSLWASNERYQCLVLGGGEGLGENDQGNRDANANKGLAVHNDWATNFSQAYEALNLDIPATDSPKPGDFDSDIEGDYIVRVEACNSNFDLSGCKKYTNNGVDSYRPVGILQQYASESDALWGLITGSYENNKEGGYLRKNLEAFANELDASGDFLVPDAGSIVSTLNAFRIAGWEAKDSDGDNHDGVAYNETSGNANSCYWGRRFNATTNGHCIDWGNPLGEILADTYRYFAGVASANNDVDAAVATQEPKAPNNVKHAPWNPVTDSGYSKYTCAKLNVIGLNTSAQSHDNNIQDFLSGIASKQATTDAGSTTLDEVRTATSSLLDGAKGKKFFVGSDGTPAVDSGISCDPKKLTDGNLANAVGACFDSPSQNGTWLGAGLAKIVSGEESDITDEGENNYDLNASLEGKQKVITHGLQLATALPQVKLKIGSGDTAQQITISPACENRGNNDIPHPNATFWGNCGLVDFNVLRIEESEGVFYVNWEENQEGGDYDQDMHGLLSYRIVNNGGTNYLEVTTQVLGQSSESRLGFGYILSGVSDELDGLHFHTGINGFPGLATYGFDTLATYVDDQNMTRTSNCTMRMGTASVYNAYSNSETGGFNGCGIDDGATTAQYEISASASNESNILDPVLEFAAKASGGTFVQVNTPTLLKEKLEEVVAGAMSDQPIGTSEVAASGVSAGGLFLHTLSYPQKDKDGERVQWIGQIGALRVDENNQLRDVNGAFLNFVGSGADAKVSVTPAVGGAASLIDFDDIQYFWSTTNTLAAQVSDANKGRRIYTSVVAEPTGGNLADTNVVVPMTPDDPPKLDATFANSATTDFLLGGVGNPLELVNYINGTESDNTRSRTLGNATYLLGDISTSPLIQSTPDYSYFREFGDSGYRDYVDAYKSARNVVYVASNDGMIHAINAGVKSGDGFADGGPASNKTVGLGEELWAYVPFNLLPHLQWLPNKNYTRVPYFDGYMRTFDVKAWPQPDPDPNPDPESEEQEEVEPDVHIGGWGTILVVGTGMGGGHYPIQTDDDDAPEIVTKPAYIVLDITDRNATHPTVIAEISHEQLGFTTAEPEVIRRVVKSGDTETSEWYLVFGSGPRGNDIDDRRTAQTSYTVPAYEETDEGEDLSKPYLFAFKIYDGSLTPVNPIEVPVAADGAFIGSINSMDWDRDFEDDAMYFGTIAGDETTPTGKLLRATINFENGLSLSPSVMYDAGKPVVKRPVTVINQGTYWVFAGTGRYYTRGDGAETHSDNVYVGLKEARTTTGGINGTYSFATNKLFNSDGVVVDTGGNLYNADGSKYTRDGTTLSTVASLRQHIKRDEPLEVAEDETPLGETPLPFYDGWIRTFGTNERQHAQVGYLASTLFVGTTVPGAGEGCSSGDQGSLYVWDMRSGVASPFVQDEAYTRKFNVAGGKEVDAVNLPIGLDGAAPDIRDPSTPLFNTAGGGIGELPELKVDIPSQRHSWREVTIPW